MLQFSPDLLHICNNVDHYFKSEIVGIVIILSHIDYPYNFYLTQYHWLDPETWKVFQHGAPGAQGSIIGTLKL